MNEAQPPDAILLSPDADHDLDRALMALFEHSPAAASALLDAVNDTLNLLASRRLEGSVSTLPSGERCRRFYEHPFWIYYQRAPGALRVLRLHHHKRDPL